MFITATTSDGKHTVRVVGQSADVVAACPQFQNWLDRFDHKHLNLRMVNIQSADIFIGGKVVFVKMECDVVKRKNKQSIPGIVFLRGDAVAILVFVVCEETGQVFVVTTKQARVPLGNAGYVEIPAGMMDKQDGIVSRAIAELREETGLVVGKDKLRQLGAFCPSAGGCDEEIVCFATFVRVSGKQMRKLAKKLHGVPDEGEEMTIQFRPLSVFLSDLRDGKILDGKALVAMMQFILNDTQLFAEITRQLAYLALSHES